jgi:transposase
MIRERIAKFVATRLSATVEAREIISYFHKMIRRKNVDALPSRLERAAGSLVASFGSEVRKDEAAVRAAITSPWSYGQTDGQITMLKLIKRQIFGRGKLDFLKGRMIGAA